MDPQPSLYVMWGFPKEYSSARWRRVQTTKVLWDRNHTRSKAVESALLCNYSKLEQKALPSSLPKRKEKKIPAASCRNIPAERNFILRSGELITLPSPPCDSGFGLRGKFNVKWTERVSAVEFWNQFHSFQFKFVELKFHHESAEQIETV